MIFLKIHENEWKNVVFSLSDNLNGQSKTLQQILSTYLTISPEITEIKAIRTVFDKPHEEQ